MNLQEFQAYQEKEQELKDLMETAKFVRSQARKPYPHRNNEYEIKKWQADVNRARASLSVLEPDLAERKSEINKMRKVATLGYGEWIKEEKLEKNLAGSSKYYTHPEFGTVKHYFFGGWSMQRVAASSSVEWIFDGKTYRREWSGNNARESARNYLKNVFGI